MLDPRTQSILCPILIGRDTQVAALARLVEQARAGHGQLALISGEAGIGKSRLVAEVKTLATDQDFAILQGNCFAPDRALPYAPLIDLLRNFCASHSSNQLIEPLRPYAADLVKLLPELATFWPDLPTPPFANPEQEKRRIFQTITQFFVEHNAQSFGSAQDKFAIDHSRLIIIEDLHWCDDTSLDFLLHLARRLANLPLFLLLSYRNDEAQTSLKQFLVDLDRGRLASELRLSRLPTADTELMIRSIFEQSYPVRQEFVDRIHALTEGNPFFVEETLKSLVEAGDIFYVDGHWDRKALGELHVPRTVQLAVTQRSAQLSPSAHEVLTLAAVAGRRFDFMLLQTLTGHDDRTLVRLIKELLRAQLLVEESAEGFAFRHALTQQAIYSDLLRRERKPLHRSVAESIETLYADTLESRLADLAYHYHCAEVWPKTLDYARRAAERARNLFSPQAALEHFARAIEAVNQIAAPQLQKAELYRARGQVYEQVGAFEEARADYEAVLSAVRAANSPQAIWQALMDVGFLWAQRDYTQAGDFFQQALATVRGMNDPLLVAHTLKRLGNWHMNVEQPNEAIAQLDEALRIFEELQDQRGVAETLDVLAIANFAGANAIAGSHHYAQAIEHFRQLGDLGGELNSLAVYAPRHMVYINNAAIWPTTSVRERLADGEAALMLARKLGAKPAEALALIWPGNTLGIAGDYVRALQRVQAGLALAESIEHLHFITTGHMVLSSIYWEMLLWPEAYYHGERALTGARQSQSLVWLGGILGYLASTLLRQGDPDQAERVLSEMWHPALPKRTNGQRQLWTVRAELLLVQHQPSAALSIVEQLIASDPHSTRLGENAIPRLVCLRGEALAALGRYAEAETTLIAAQPFAQMAPPQLWRLHLTLGNCYRRQNRRNEADQLYTAARALLSQLAAIIDDVDLRQRFETQTAALFPAATEKQVAKQSFAGLTAKEREVVALIGQGKSNKEIANVMVVSHRTVETHVSNILSKLHLATRAQIAVWAKEQKHA